MQLLIRDVALKPDGISFEDIAKKYGIQRSTLTEYRNERADEILQVQNDFFNEHKGDVMKALIESAKGFYADTPDGMKQYAPNAKSIELFFSIQQQVAKTEDTDVFRLFDIFWPRKKQAEFIYGGDPEGKLFINLAITGIGWGKTVTLIHKATTLARRNRGRTGMVVSPTYKMLQNPVMSYFLEMLGEVNTKNKYNKNAGELTLWGDTTVLLRSCDNYENLRGPNVAWVCGDELRNWDFEAFRILLGRIRDPKSTVREFAGVTTPWGFNWIYDLIEKHEGLGEAKLSVIRGKTEENYALPGDFIEMVRANYDAEYAEQELDGTFLNLGVGRIYPKYDRAIHVKDLRFDPSLPVWIGQDFNVNPMASVICQPRRRPDMLTDILVLDELSVKGGVQDTIKALKEKGFDPKTYRGEIVLYPDATGWNNNAAAERSSLQQLKDAGYTIQSPKANPLIRDRYAAVNGKLCNAHGVATLFIDPKCKQLRTDLEREVYQEGAPIREKTKDGAATRGHHSDALGYIIHREFAIESGFRPARIS